MKAIGVSPTAGKVLLMTCLAVLLLAVTVSDGRCRTPVETMAIKRAQSLWENRHWEQGVLAYEDYLRHYPRGAHAAQAHLHIGLFLEGHNRLEEALKYYEAGLSVAEGRNHQVLLTDIAAIHQKYGRHQEAVRIYQQIMRQPASWDLFKIANKRLLSLHYIKAFREKHGKQANRCGEESLKTVLTQLGIAPRPEVLNLIPRDAGDLTSLLALQQAALAHGVKSYGVKIDGRNPDLLSAPAILLLSPAHFAVLRGVSPQGVHLSVPREFTQEDQTLSRERLQQSWTGYALCFAPTAPAAQGLTRLQDREMQKVVGGVHEPGDTYISNKGTDVGNAMIDPPRILVNSFSLNMVLEDVDGVWKGMGLPVVLKRTYNSEDATSGMFGHSWRFQYEVSLTEDTSGNVTLTRGDGRVDVFTPKGDGTYVPPKRVFDRLVKNPDGTFTLWAKKLKATYSFGTDLRLSQIVDQNSNALDFTWSANGITAITIHYASDTKTISFEYGSLGKCTRVTLPDGRYATFTYGSGGNLQSSTNLAGYTTSYTYNANNYITAITTPYGTTQVVYQISPGNYKIYAPQKVIDSLGAVSQFALDNLDIVYTDGRLHQTRFTGDGATGFTGTITDAAGGATTYTYDSYGNTTSVTDPNGAKWVLAYGTDPSRGNLTQSTDPRGKSATLTYAGDDLTTIDVPQGRHTAFAYDANHNLIKVTDALSRETALTYNQWGKITQIALPGNPIPANTFQYDEYGNLLAETDPAGYTTSYGYDGAGRLISRTDGNGKLLKLAYDNLDRLTGVFYTDGSVLYTYDSTALRQVTAKDRRTMTFAYDKLGRLVNFKDINGFLLHYTYDSMGNLTALTYPGNKVVSYKYDVANRLDNVTDWLGTSTTYAYDKVGNVAQITYPNGTGAQLFYDQNQRLMVYQNSGVPGQPLPQFAYLLDDLGNRTGETRRYANYEEPAWKNILSQYDSADRIINAGTTMFQHDANGNLLQKAVGANSSIFAYNTNNMLTKLVTPAQLYKYEYDPLLNRVARQEGNSRKLSVVDPRPTLSKLLMQTTTGKNPTDYYIYGLGLISRIDASGNVYYYHYNAIGSTVAITDMTGTPVNRYDYDPFGNLVSNFESFQNPFRYVGQHGVMDEGNGLLYMRARYYDSSIGRFIGKDPLIFLQDYLNPFVYAKNNPMKYMDPSGLLAKNAWNGVKGAWEGILVFLDSVIGNLLPTVASELYTFISGAATIVEECPEAIPYFIRAFDKKGVYPRVYPGITGGGNRDNFQGPDGAEIERQLRSLYD